LSAETHAISANLFTREVFAISIRRACGPGFFCPVGGPVGFALAFRLGALLRLAVPCLLGLDLFRGEAFPLLFR